MTSSGKSGGDRTTAGHGAPLWTRRRVLVAGIVAVGGVGIAGADLLTNGFSSPPSFGGAFAPAASATAGRRSFRSRPDLTPPVVTLTGRPVLDGHSLLLTPSNGTGVDGPAIFDPSGELVWMRPGNGNAATDLHVIDFGGRPALTWWEGSNDAGIGSGEFVVVDAAYREIARIRGGDGRPADLHELQLTTRGTAILFADAPVSGPVAGRPNSMRVMDCAVQEIDLATGRLLWEWHATDHIGLDESFSALPTVAGKIHDYVHGNSIEEDTDGNLLVSARNTSTVYKVDRGNGEILWRLGGKRSDFRFGPGASFGWQHDVRRRFDGTITMFDNSAAAAPGRSRGLRLRIDESARTATLVAAYAQPHGLLSTSQGNVQLLEDGGVFIGWGSQPFFSQFSSDGRLAMDATFPAATQSYRTYRQQWIGRPAEAPMIAVPGGPDGSAGSGGPSASVGSSASPVSDGTIRAFASWNGATDVAWWDLLAGSTGSDLAVVASARRTGFETALSAPTPAGGFGFVAARARDILGEVLGRSAIVRLQG